MTLPSQSAGHTPGPWYFDDGNGGEYFPHVVIGGDDPKSKNYITINTARGKNGGASMAEHQANARLIARAPDLLAENSKLKGQLEEAVAALEKVCFMIEHGWISPDVIGDTQEGWDKACQAYRDSKTYEMAKELLSKLKEAGS